MKNDKCDACSGFPAGGGPCESKKFTKAVVEINNPKECPILFHKVVIPVSMGDDTDVPPVIGKYRNVLLVYEANNHSYLYSSDGIPTRLNNGFTDYEDAINLPQINGVTLLGDKSSADLKLADAPLVITVASDNTSWSGADTAEEVYNFFLNKGKVNIVFNGGENYAYEITSAAYIPGEEKMMCIVTVATATTGETTEFDGNTLFGTMILYTADKAIDVSQIELQPKLFVADFTGLDLNYNELSGVPATTYSIGMVKPGTGLSVDSSGTLSALGASSNVVMGFDDTSDMVNGDSFVDGSVAKTCGFHSAKDGGGAKYLIRELQVSDVINNITLFALTNFNSLVAELVAEEPVNVKQLGAYGDNSHDDTGVLQFAVSNYTEVYFPTGTYLVDDEIVLGNNIILRGDNATIKGTYSDPADDIISISGDRVIIDGVNLEGNGRYGIGLDGDFCTIKNLTISETTYSGVMVLGDNNTIENVIGYQNGWDCVSNYGTTKNTLVKNCKAIKCVRHGFSTDPTVSGITFEDCYAENIGNPTLDEGHSSFHIENSDSCRIVGCRAYYDSDHAGNSAASVSSQYFGFRIYGSTNVVVDGITVEFADSFAPQNTAFTASISNQSFMDDNLLVTNSYFVNNSSAANVGNVYISNSKPDFINDYFKDVVLSEQDSYNSYIHRMVDCTVDLPNTTNGFAYYKYLCEDAEVTRCRFKGNASSSFFFKGRFVNTKFVDCIFDTAIDSIILSNESGNYDIKSQNSQIVRCTFKNLIRGIYLEFVENLTNYIRDCLFSGDITTVIQGNYNSATMTGCQKLGLTYVNLSDGNLYFTVFNDLKTSYDFQQLALNPSNARYSISIDGSGNVVATAI